MRADYIGHLLISIAGFGITYLLCQLIQPKGWHLSDYLAVLVPFILLTLLVIATNNINLPDIPVPMLITFFSFIGVLVFFPLRQTWTRFGFISSTFILIYFLTVIVPELRYSPLE